jgi:hypothetical protein
MGASEPADEPVAVGGAPGARPAKAAERALGGACPRRSPGSACGAAAAAGTRLSRRVPAPSRACSRGPSRGPVASATCTAPPPLRGRRSAGRRAAIAICAARRVSIRPCRSPLRNPNQPLSAACTRAGSRRASARPPRPSGKRASDPAGAVRRGTRFTSRRSRAAGSRGRPAGNALHVPPEPSVPMRTFPCRGASGAPQDSRCGRAAALRLQMQVVLIYS